MMPISTRNTVTKDRISHKMEGTALGFQKTVKESGQDQEGREEVTWGEFPGEQK